MKIIVKQIVKKLWKLLSERKIEVIMKKVNYGTFTNPPSLSFANYCDGLDAKRQGDTSRAIYERLQNWRNGMLQSYSHRQHPVIHIQQTLKPWFVHKKSVENTILEYNEFSLFYSFLAQMNNVLFLA